MGVEQFLGRGGVNPRTGERELREPIDPEVRAFLAALQNANNAIKDHIEKKGKGKSGAKSLADKINKSLGDMCGDFFTARPHLNETSNPSQVVKYFVAFGEYYNLVVANKVDQGLAIRIAVEMGLLNPVVGRLTANEFYEKIKRSYSREKNVEVGQYYIDPYGFSSKAEYDGQGFGIGKARTPFRVDIMMKWFTEGVLEPVRKLEKDFCIFSIRITPDLAAKLVVAISKRQIPLAFIPKVEK